MKVKSIRRIAAAGLAVAALAGTTACSAINEQATTMPYAVSDGVANNTEGLIMDSLIVNNLAIVSADKNGEGNFIGTLASKTDKAFQATITINGEDYTFDVPADPAGLRLEQEEPVTVSDHGSEPGRLVDAKISAEGETIEMKVPVLAPGLKEYEQFAPGDVDLEEQTAHQYEFEGQFAPEEEK